MYAYTNNGYLVNKIVSAVGRLYINDSSQHSTKYGSTLHTYMAAATSVHPGYFWIA